MRDALREMIKNLAFERIKSDNEEYVKYRSFIKKNPEDENSDYIIESKPLDEYVDDSYRYGFRRRENRNYYMGYNRIIIYNSLCSNLFPLIFIKRMTLLELLQ